MEEAFLHFLWEQKKFDFTNAETTKAEKITIINVGMHNEHAGPDFFNSKIRIGDQLWAGNVEIHLKSSLWYAHQHQNDVSYDNVVLHVVWEHDREVLRKDASEIPVLALKNFVSEASLQKYYALFNESVHKWINCEKDFAQFDDFELYHWLERLYMERLEVKADEIFQILEKSGNDWEEVLFKMLCKNFGLNLNGDAFLSMAYSIPFAVVRKERKKRQNIEALLFGQAKLLDTEKEIIYHNELRQIYEFQKNKYKLDNNTVTPVKYFRLRPDNFPSIRLAQLAALYASEEKLFAKIIEADDIASLQKIFEVEVSEFWQSHYNFKKQSKRKSKKISKNFIDLLIINTVIPIKFCFAKQQGKEVGESVLNLASSIKTEKNSIISNFNKMRKNTAQNALHSQALLQMKRNYCDSNLCLKCNLGTKLLRN